MPLSLLWTCRRGYLGYQLGGYSLNQLSTSSPPGLGEQDGPGVPELASMPPESQPNLDITENHSFPDPDLGSS